MRIECSILCIGKIGGTALIRPVRHEQDFFITTGFTKTVEVPEGAKQRSLRSDSVLIVR